MRKHAAAAADPGIVEQEMDLVGVVLTRDFVAEPVDLRLVRHIGEMGRDPQPLRYAGGLTEPLRLGHAVGRHVAHRHIASLGDEKAHKLPPHTRAAARHDRDPPRQVFHSALPLGSAPSCAKLAVPTVR
jgi:hypothetical protein